MASRLSLGLASLAAVLALSTCSKHSPLAAPAAPLTPPTHLCNAHEAPPGCRGAQQVEKLLGTESSILGMADTPSGSQGAKILTLRATLGGQNVVFRAKWRPQSSADLINEPRKELASYAVQKLFLKDSELVAPPTVAHCFPLAEYRAFAPGEKPTFPGTECVFGFASYWLEHVETIDSAHRDGLLSGEGIWDATLFERDPLYRASIAKANLLTYVINHGDAHNEQFLIESTPRGLRAYVVDNSISFLSIPNPMLLFREDWAKIQVPLLPKDSIDRLKQVTNNEYAQLGLIAEFELRGQQLLPVEPTSGPSPDGQALSWSGSRLRVGLTPKEIDLVKSRIRALLDRPDLPKLIGSDVAQPSK